MKGRITRAIVGIAAFVVVLLGIPLALVVQHFYESRATVELQRTAAQAIAELTVPLHANDIADAASEPDAPAGFSVYDVFGDRLFGPGPERVDAPPDGRLVVVSPITDRSTEEIVGSVRVSQPADIVAGEARRAWALMAVAAVVGLALAFAVARREAARLAAPISALAARAERLGSEPFERHSTPTGTPELDTLADALTMSSLRLAELVVREREFSANASHQLRTPLAALRVSIEGGDAAAALAQTDRLAATVDHLLAVARDELPSAGVVDVSPVVVAAAERWRPVFSAADRQLEVDVVPDLPSVCVRLPSVDQTLDVLLENAFRHGAGITRVAARRASGGLVVQVDDDGPGVDPAQAASVFDRHEGVGSGIGLALARTLLEADGGRLLLADPEHAAFRIVLANASTDPSSPSPDEALPV